MEEFLNKLQKTRRDFLGRMRLLSILDLITIFCFFYAIFIILNMEYLISKTALTAYLPVKFLPPLIALMIAVLSSIILHRKDKKINVIELIEKKYSDLHEKLSTAYDSREETNIIVDSLKSMVSDLMVKVSPSLLLAKKMIISKLVIAFIFAAGIIIISNDPAGYQIPENTLDNMTKIITGENNSEPIDITGLTQNSDNIGKKGSGDIFGKPKIASIEGKNIDLTLYSGMDTGFTVNEAGVSDDQFIKSGAYPVDVIGSNVSDSGYTMLMKKTETEKQLINQYAVKMSEIITEVNK